MVRLVLSAVLAAQPSEPVELRVDPCLVTRHDIAPEALRAAVELESLEESPPEGASISVSCTADGLLLHRSRPRPAVERTLGIDPIAPAVRARVLALAIVELAVQPATAPRPAEPPRPPAPPPPPDPPPALRDSDRPWQADVGLTSRVFIPSTWLVGGRLGIAHRPRPHLGWSAALDLAGGRYATALGDISALSLSGALGLFGHDRVARSVRLSGGVSAAVGWARLAGDARANATAGRIRGPWLGPLADLRIEFLFGPRWSLGLRAELGYAIIGVRAFADDQVAAGIDGVWVGGNVQVGWAFAALGRRD